MGFVNVLKNGYRLDVVTFSDVFASMDFSNDIDAILTKDIITDIEKKAGETIKENKTVLIPYFGSVRKSAVKKELLKTYKVLKYARKTMDKEEYKQYARENYKQCVEKAKNVVNSNRKLVRLTALNRKLYNKKFKALGETFANTWIYSLSLIKVVDFDEEVEEMFKLLNNETSNRKPNIGR